jgi:hypothetical protein
MKAELGGAWWDAGGRFLKSNSHDRAQRRTAGNVPTPTAIVRGVGYVDCTCVVSNFTIGGKRGGQPDCQIFAATGKHTGMGCLPFRVSSPFLDSAL